MRSSRRANERRCPQAHTRAVQAGPGLLRRAQRRPAPCLLVPWLHPAAGDAADACRRARAHRLAAYAGPAGQPGRDADQGGHGRPRPCARQGQRHRPRRRLQGPRLRGDVSRRAAAPAPAAAGQADRQAQADAARDYAQKHGVDILVGLKAVGVGDRPALTRPAAPPAGVATPDQRTALLHVRQLQAAHAGAYAAQHRIGFVEAVKRLGIAA